AATKSLAQLEAAFGGALFERSGRRRVLTALGEALLPRARALVQQARDMEAEARRWRSGEDGLIRLGAGPAVAFSLLPGAVKRFYSAGSAARLTVRSGAAGELIERLRRGELDLMVGAWPKIADPMFTTEVVLVDRLEVVARAGHPLAGRPVRRQELLDFPWALPPASQKWRQALDELFMERGLDPPAPQVVSNSAGYLQALIRQSDYLSFLPRQLLDLDGAADFTTLSVDMARLEPEISMTFRERALLKAHVSELVQVLRSLGPDFAD
ncbi:MAG: LysR family transcriptional regulator, partial [Thermaurantiacus sp.]